jgi:hypothetical protein
LAKLIINPTFHTFALVLHFYWISLIFWNIGEEGDVVMDAIYKNEQN